MTHHHDTIHDTGTEIPGMIPEEDLMIPTFELHPTEIPKIVPWIIAHRGNSKDAPENTIPAFEEALNLKVGGIELDTHTLKDGKIVVIHDFTFDRTTNSVKKFGKPLVQIKGKSLKQVKSLDAGIWKGQKYKKTKVPTLKEALQLILKNKSCIAFIDQKAGKTKELFDFLKNHEWLDKVVVQSSNWDFIEKFNELAPEIKIGTACLGPPRKDSDGKNLSREKKFLNAEYINDIISRGAKFVTWNHYVTKESISLAHQKGLRVLIYTIDDPEEANKLITLGVDGIITNDPKTITEKLGK